MADTSFNVSAVLRADASSFVAGTQAAGAANDQLASSIGKTSSALDTSSRSVANASAGHKHLADSAGNASAAQAILQSTIRKSVDQFSAGAPFATIFAEHLETLAEAAQLSGGSLGKVGAFLGGPWGIALTAATSIAAPFIAKLFEANNELEQQRDKLDKVAKGADAFGNAEALLGKVLDLSTGSLKTHNQVLVETIKLQAQLNVLTAQADLKKATTGLQGLAKPTWMETVSDAAASLGGGIGAPAASGAGLDDRAIRTANLKPLSDTFASFSAIMNDPKASPDAIGAALKSVDTTIDQLAASGKLAGRNLIDVKTGLAAAASQAQAIIANKQVLDVLNGGAIPADLKPYEKAKKPKKPADTSGLVNSVQNDIASFTGQFTDAPTFIEKADAALRKLDQDAAALEKRKPPNYQALLAQIATTKDLINANLNKPFDDYLKQQDEAIHAAHLLATGHEDEANAYKAILGLQKQQGPLSEGQKQQVLETVVALRQEQEAYARLREAQQPYLDALSQAAGTIKGLFEGTTKLKDAPKQFLAGFKKLSGDELFQSLGLGDLFDDLKKSVQQQSPIAKAGEQFAGTVRATLDPLDRLTAGASKAADALAGLSSPSGGLVNSAYNMPGLLPQTTGTDSNPTEITVTGMRRQPGESAAAFYDRIGAAIGAKIDQRLGTDFAKKVGGRIGDALQGAALGGQAGDLFSAVTGVKGSAIGSKIGGALGEGLGKDLVGKGLTAISGKLATFAGPLAGVLGGIAGDLVGGLLTSTKKATATIGSAFTGATVTGNSSAYEQAVSGLAAGVQGSLKDVVKQLGGELGNFAVSITQKGKKFIVDASGQGKTTRGKSNDGVVTYDSADDAEAAALVNAIADGAVKGLSPAVAAALRSSTDVNAAVQEALNVENLEASIGGVQGAMEQELRTFEATAQQRVELARKYGLDLVKVDALNEKERASTIQSIVKAQTGSLSDLLTSMTSGDLFEGSIVDKIKALQGQIASAVADFNNGVDGAGDKLASLDQSYLDATKTAYGTAGGEYAAARDEVQKSITDLIAQTTKQAQDAQTAIDQQLGLANENNDLTAQTNTLLGNISTQLGAIAASGAGLGGNMRSGVARQATIA